MLEKRNKSSNASKNKIQICSNAEKKQTDVMKSKSSTLGGTNKTLVVNFRR